MYVHACTHAHEMCEMHVLLEDRDQGWLSFSESLHLFLRQCLSLNQGFTGSAWPGISASPSLDSQPPLCLVVLLLCFFKIVFLYGALAVLGFCKPGCPWTLRSASQNAGIKGVCCPTWLPGIELNVLSGKFTERPGSCLC